MNARSERAGAKVTLSLRVLGRRPDGYHDLDALVAIVDAPHDELSFIDGASDSELVVAPGGAAPADATNLVWKARAALGSSAGLHLRKGIPSQAGLGGGSADAAATLRLLRDGRSDAELFEIATALGADVPVCLHAGIWRMRGIGDVVDPVPPPSAPVHLVLATPPFGCSTPEVFAAWDDLGGSASPRAVAGPFGGASWRNDLEPAALRTQPALAEFREHFAARAGAQPVLCGSGSTYFVVVPSHDAATLVAADVRAAIPTRCVAIATVAPGGAR